MELTRKEREAIGIMCSVNRILGLPEKTGAEWLELWRTLSEESKDAYYIVFYELCEERDL